VPKYPWAGGKSNPSRGLPQSGVRGGGKKEKTRGRGPQGACVQDLTKKGKHYRRGKWASNQGAPKESHKNVRAFTGLTNKSLGSKTHVRTPVNLFGRGPRPFSRRVQGGLKWWPVQRGGERSVALSTKGQPFQVRKTQIVLTGGTIRSPRGKKSGGGSVSLVSNNGAP